MFILIRVHTEPGNPGKVVNLKQAFSGPGIAWILGVLVDWLEIDWNSESK